MRFCVCHLSSTDRIKNLILKHMLSILRSSHQPRLPRASVGQGLVHSVNVRFRRLRAAVPEFESTSVAESDLLVSLLRRCHISSHLPCCRRGSLKSKSEEP